MHGAGDDAQDGETWKICPPSEEAGFKNSKAHCAEICYSDSFHQDSQAGEILTLQRLLPRVVGGLGGAALH